jgi:hypothetical protein
MKSEIQQHKYQALLSRLDRGMVRVFINSEYIGVSLPANLMNHPEVILNLSYGFKLDVFDVTQWGVVASLSFGGQPFNCELPWESIYYIQSALDDEEGIFYFESLPDRLAHQFRGLVDEKLRLEAQHSEIDDSDSTDSNSTDSDSKEYHVAPDVDPKPHVPQFSFSDEDDFYSNLEFEEEHEEQDEDPPLSSWVQTLPRIHKSALLDRSKLEGPKKS